MSFFNKMLEVAGFADPIEDDEDITTTTPTKSNRPVVSLHAGEESGAKAAPSSRMSNLVTFQAGKETSGHKKDGAQVILTEPVRFDDAVGIVNNILAGKAVILNLELCDYEVAIKLIDFISGAAYAIDGTIQKISSDIFVISPPNIDITNELKAHMTGEEQEVATWVNQYNNKGDF